MHWYSDEKVVMQRMREIQRQADRAQAWGLVRRDAPTVWHGLQRRLAHWLIALGEYLQRGKAILQKLITRHDPSYGKR